MFNSTLSGGLHLRVILAATLVLVTAMCMTRPHNAVAAPADDENAINWAYYEDAEIWLQRKADDPKARQLFFKLTADATPRVVVVAVPPHDTTMPSDWSERVALGLDSTGELTAVVTSTRGLYWTHLTDGPQLHRVARTSKHDSFPSIFRGRIAYDHQRGTRSSVRVGSLTGRSARTVWTNASNRQWVAIDTAIGAGSAVAFSLGSDGAESGLFDAKLARPRGPVIDVWPGDHHDGPISLQVTSSGRRLTVAASGSHAVIRYALPSGSRLH